MAETETKNSRWVKGQSGNPRGRPRKDHIKPFPDLEEVGLTPQKGSQELAWNVKADFVIYGGSAGSGKSHLLLMLIAKYISDPNFHAAVFRRNTKQIKQQGGLWEESKKLYEPFEPKTNGSDLKHSFRTGASATFNHLEHEKHKYSFQGGQISAALFDELK